MHKSIFGDITGIADLSKALIENVWLASFWDKKLGVGGRVDKKIPNFSIFFVRDDYSFYLKSNMVFV